MKLNLGAGADVLEGYINHDLVALPGIDITHNLNQYPWPWDDGSIQEVKIFDVLEHLDDFIKAIEELYRILSPQGRCHINVPYWNSWCVPSDPTHKRGFHETTFRFFDPDSIFCQTRPYYSRARFRVVDEKFVLAPFGPYFYLPHVGEIKVSSSWGKRIIGLIGNYFVSNLIHDLQLTLEKA